MLKSSKLRKLSRKTWLVLGLVLTVSTIGVSGCGAKMITTEASTTQTTTSGQENTEQSAQKQTPNPAIEAAMEIRTLQGNQQMVLTGDQKDKIKPILQLLIDTTNPSQDFLQEKADAIKAVYTEQQKTYLSTNTSKGKPSKNNRTGQEPPKDQARDQTKGQGGDQKGDITAPSGQLQNIYKQVLASLT